METHNIVLLLRGGAVKVCIALYMAASGYKIILSHKMPRDIKAGIMRMRTRRDFYANRAGCREAHTAREAPTDRFNFARRRQSILSLSMGNSHDREREREQHDLSRLERRHLPRLARNKRAVVLLSRRH